jgi:precorrin-2 dehydrogenase/sirohydrochlorin ferrochelatase
VVKVVSPDLCPELIELAGGETVSFERRPFEPDDLAGAVIAVAATNDNEANTAVAKEGRARRVAVNVVDDPDNSDFIAPACVRRGDLTIAVSTAGRSPALARKIRARLEAEFGEEYARLTLLLGQVRAEMRSQGVKVDGDDWQDALDLDALASLLKNNDWERAERALRSRLNALHSRGETLCSFI